MDPSLSLHPKSALNGERHSPEAQAHGATAQGLNLNRAISLPSALKNVLVGRREKQFNSGLKYLDA